MVAFGVLSNILSVEVVIKLEEETETDTDIRYAKAVVHADIEEPLIIEIIVRHEGQDHQIHITYEVCNHEVCISCGAFGHSHQDCDGEPGEGNTWDRFNLEDVQLSPWPPQQQQHKKHLQRIRWRKIINKQRLMEEVQRTHLQRQPRLQPCSILTHGLWWYQSSWSQILMKIRTLQLDCGR